MCMFSGSCSSRKGGGRWGDVFINNHMEGMMLGLTSKKLQVKANIWTSSSWYPCWFWAVEQRMGDTQRDSPEILNQNKISIWITFSTFLSFSACLDTVFLYPSRYFPTKWRKRLRYIYSPCSGTLMETLHFLTIKYESYFLSNSSVVIKYSAMYTCYYF